MQVDYKPLSEPLTKEDREAFTIFKQSVPRSTIAKLETPLKITGTIVLVGFLLFVLVTAAYSVFSLFIFVFLVILFLLPLAMLAEARKRLAKMYAFARRNNATLQLYTEISQYDGVFFWSSPHSKIVESYIFENGLEIGIFDQVNEFGGAKSLHPRGYMKCTLPRKLPHMILRTTANRAPLFPQSPLALFFGQNQQLRLGGDFDKYFSIAVPAGYEQDAFYIFTPDVLQALKDYGTQYDIEIIGDSLYFHNEGGVILSNAESMQYTIRAATVLANEIIHQGDYYADHRVADRSLNIIAEQGRAMKPSLTTLPKVLTAICIVFALVALGVTMFT